MSLKLNPEVNLFGLRPELLLAMFVAEQVYATYGHDLVITSVTDGKHSKASLHYVGAAFDCRTRDIDSLTVFHIKNEILARLPYQTYDVLIETDPPHIHIEFQPKR